MQMRPAVLVLLHAGSQTWRGQQLEHCYSFSLRTHALPLHRAQTAPGVMQPVSASYLPMGSERERNLSLVSNLKPLKVFVAP
jgi:hypothetical protein